MRKQNKLYALILILLLAGCKNKQGKKISKLSNRKRKFLSADTTKLLSALDSIEERKIFYKNSYNYYYRKNYVQKGEKSSKYIISSVFLNKLQHEEVDKTSKWKNLAKLLQKG